MLPRPLVVLLVKAREPVGAKNQAGVPLRPGEFDGIGTHTLFDEVDHFLVDSVGHGCIRGALVLEDVRPLEAEEEGVAHVRPRDVGRLRRRSAGCFALLAHGARNRVVFVVDDGNGGVEQTGVGRSLMAARGDTAQINGGGEVGYVGSLELMVKISQMSLDSSLPDDIVLPRFPLVRQSSIGGGGAARAADWVTYLGPARLIACRFFRPES